MDSKPQEELRELFIDGMSKAACTVNIVTTDGTSGLAGLTVSAMCSVSADPTSLLVCVHEQSRACEIIRENAAFCVNVLQEDQSHISDTFAGRFGVEDKFSCGDWVKLQTGSPVLDGALTNFDCSLKKSFKWGSHYILIGQVEDITSGSSGNPLIYANRAYGRAISMDVESLKSGPVPGAKQSLRLGAYLNVSAFFIPGLVASFGKENPNLFIDVVEGSHLDLVGMIQDAKLDTAIMYLQDDSDHVDKTLLAELEPYVLLPYEHPLADLTEVSLSQLSDYPLVSLATPSGGSGYIDSLFEQTGINPVKGYSATSFEMLRGMVAHGLGYAITVTKPAANMSYDGVALARKPLKDSVIPAKLYIAHRDEDTMDANTRAFINFIKDYFRQLA